MNEFLSDILAQPAAIDQVIDIFGEKGGEAFADTVRQLAKYPRLVLTSMGSAYYSLVPMYYVLSQYHPSVSLVETADLLKRSPTADTATIIMSRSGESREISVYARTLREAGRFLLAITMTPDSTLGRNADMLLYDPAPYDHLICTKAYSSMALVGLLLAARLRACLPGDLASRLRALTAWMESSKLDMLKKVQALPWLGESLTFLSEGVGVGLAMSGCLWMGEGARLRADYSSYSQFRHGGVEMVDKDFHAVSIELEEDPAVSQSARFIREKGAHLARIGLDDDGVDFVIPAFDLPAEYRLLAASMPVQMMAYQSGINRGHQPGEMRYLGWVVK